MATLGAIGELHEVELDQVALVRRNEHARDLRPRKRGDDFFGALGANDDRLALVERHPNRREVADIIDDEGLIEREVVLTVDRERRYAST